MEAFFCRIQCANVASSLQVLSFNEISDLNGLAGLNRLQHLDLGYNVIAGGYGDIGYFDGSDEDSLIATDDNVACPNDKCSKPLTMEKASSDIAAGTGRKNPPRTREMINLPSLTRLDLNNNILHDLDDLKVRCGHYRSRLAR